MLKNYLNISKWYCYIIEWIIITFILIFLTDEPKLPVVKLENPEAMDDDSASEDGKQPSFCVLLHGSLKVESMVAVCHLG